MAITKGKSGLLSSADKYKIDQYPTLDGDASKFVNGAGDLVAVESGGVTGVKGSSESTYRTGDVNITAANIGLDSVDNTHDSVKSVASAAKLTTSRRISIGGAVTGSTIFDGSGDVTIIAAASGTSDGDAIHNGDSNINLDNVTIESALIGGVYGGNLWGLKVNSGDTTLRALVVKSENATLENALIGINNNGNLWGLNVDDGDVTLRALVVKSENATVENALIGMANGNGLKVNSGSVTLVADVVKSENVTVENALIGMPNGNGLKVNSGSVTLVADVVKSEHATLGDNVKIGDYATLGDGARIGELARIGSNASLGDGATLLSPVIIDPDIRGLDIDSGGGVTGVKGGAESSYRTGDVNITAANIGLNNVDNTHDSVKSVAAATKATQDGSGDIIVNTYAKLSGATFTGAVNASGGLILPTTASNVNGAIWIA